MSALGSRGGRARGRKKEAHPGDAPEARAYTALDELLSSESATARVQAAKYALDRLTANSPAGLEAAKKALWLDQQAQSQAELPAARAKLARLIESRAEELRDQMAEAELRELVERRAEERAKELHEAQKAAELAAVKAEMAEAPAEGPPAERVEEMIEEERCRAERLTRELGLDTDEESGLDEES